MFSASCLRTRVAFHFHNLSCWRAPSTTIQRNITFSNRIATGFATSSRSCYRDFLAPFFQSSQQGVGRVPGWVYRQVLFGETSTLTCYSQSSMLCGARLKVRCVSFTGDLDIADVNGCRQIDSIINHPDNKHLKEAERRAEEEKRRAEESDKRAEREKHRAEEEARLRQEEKKEMERRIAELEAKLAQAKGEEGHCDILSCQ